MSSLKTALLLGFLTGLLLLALYSTHPPLPERIRRLLAMHV
jgi:Zn-dependent protease with chaperone function